MMKRNIVGFCLGAFLAACDGTNGRPGSQGGGGAPSTGSTSQGGGGAPSTGSTSQGGGGAPSTGSTSQGGGGGGVSPCGNLAEACSEDQYCLISSVPKDDGTDLIMTSECQPFPPPSCDAGAPLDELCTCLTDDAMARNANCTKLGASYSCHVQRENGVTLPGVELRCSFTP